MAEKDCCSRTAVPCSQSRCCRKESGGIRNRISCIFLLYSFIFSRNSPHCRQGVSGCHSGDPEVIFRQSARSPDMSPEEKEEAVKKISFIFSLSRRPFSFAVKKASPRNAVLLHHNSIQFPALCHQTAPPCSRKGNDPGETGR